MSWPNYENVEVWWSKEVWWSSKEVWWSSKVVWCSSKEEWWSSGQTARPRFESRPGGGLTTVQYEGRKIALLLLKK